MAYIYATALPGDIVKLGRGSLKQRARAAQTYFVDKVQVLALWTTSDAPRDERAAQRLCKDWHVRGELYKVPTDWLDLEHPLVVRVSGLLGAPIKIEPRPQAPKKFRVPRELVGASDTPDVRWAARLIRERSRIGRVCKHGHHGAIWRSGNCMACVKLAGERFKARHSRKKT